MTRREIQARRKQLEADLAAAKAQVRRVEGEFQALQEECPHPKKWGKTAMGREWTEYCDDCGWVR